MLVHFLAMTALCFFLPLLERLQFSARAAQPDIAANQQPQYADCRYRPAGGNIGREAADGVIGEVVIHVGEL